MDSFGGLGSFGSLPFTPSFTPTQMFDFSNLFGNFDFSSSFANIGASFGNAGRACNFGTTILSQPELKGKFRLATKEEIEKGGIPDGAVVLWKGGTPGFNGDDVVRRCGHGGIMYQNAVYSNCVIINHIDTCYQVWVPVKQA